MGALLQVGHDSKNLLPVPELSGFTGVVLNPVNYAPDGMMEITTGLRGRENFTVYFDPQLYNPQSERGRLREWGYFPDDVDTADQSNDQWWAELCGALVQNCEEVGANIICSPVVSPNAFTDDYYLRMVEVHEILAGMARRTGTTAQTAFVSLSDLSTPSRALAIATIISKTSSPVVYLILSGDQDPRRELDRVDELKGSMRLIRALEGAGLRVLVAFSSSDVLLWKMAGASDCATGKFFNLRRYTRGRFEEPSQGGGQLPYWIEEALIAFLRESDLRRLLQVGGVLSQASLENPFGQQIIRLLTDSPGSAWLGLSWRQYLYWFIDVERRVSSGELDVAGLLRTVERTWRQLDDADVLMEELRNDGTWIRAWRRALVEYQTF